MSRKIKTKSKTEIQKSQFSETVIRTLKAKIQLPNVVSLHHFINKNTCYINRLMLKNEKTLTHKDGLKLKQFNNIKLKIQETEEILRFFAQSLGNVRFVWNHFLALTQQKYNYFKTLTEEEKTLHTSYYTKY